jgi:replicative DNA helicase Mcm
MMTTMNDTPDNNLDFSNTHPKAEDKDSYYKEEQAKIQELEINDDLRKCGVTRFAKEDLTSCLIICEGKPITFNIQKEGLFATLQSFKDNSKGKIDKATQEAIILVLSKGEHYSNMLIHNGKTALNPSADVVIVSQSVADDKENDVEKEKINHDMVGKIRNCSNGDDNNENWKKQHNKAAQPAINVSDVLRLHSGSVKVHGMITSLSQLYKMITATIFDCRNCGSTFHVIKYDTPLLTSSETKLPKACFSCSSKNFSTSYDYVNAVTVELQDIDTFSEIERLPVLLFENDTRNIHVGERVTIFGQIQIIQYNSRGKSLPFVYADSIEYESREELTLTAADVEAIERFVKTSGTKVIERLVSLFAPSIIGYNHVKEGLLLCAANTAANDITQTKRNRIHAILVGDPGLAKSALLREATKLVLNSRYESGQNSSGKSLTAIVSKEDENYVLRLGPASLARGTFCAVNELGRIQYEDQVYLLDLMEEGEFTINKHGVNARIRAPTTIIASANPINGNWKDDDKIDLNEIPAIKPLIDRFDLLFIFRTPKDPRDIREYAYRKSELDNKIIPDYYNFLRKYIMYAKTKINPVLSEESKTMLNEYWIQLAGKFGSPRILETLFRLAKARARLKLKKIVEPEEARETMQFYNIILQQHQQVVSLPASPREVAYNECVSILKESRSAISFEELVKSACKRNEHVKCYLGIKFKLQDNIKLRPLLGMLLNHSSIKLKQERPVVLQWIEDVGGSLTYGQGSDEGSSNRNLSDAYDVYDIQGSRIDQNLSTVSSENNHKGLSTIASYASYASDSTGQVEEFFCDNPTLPWQPLPEHSLEESPCYPIISKKGKFYYCKVHPSIENIYLETIEHHCKYKEPDVHKSEILRLLSAARPSTNFGERKT